MILFLESHLPSGLLLSLSSYADIGCNSTESLTKQIQTFRNQIKNVSSFSTLKEIYNDRKI